MAHSRFGLKDNELLFSRNLRYIPTSTVCYAVGAEFSRTNFAEGRVSLLVTRVTSNGSQNHISRLARGFGAGLLSRPESLQLFQGGDQFLKELEFQNHNRRDKNQHDQT